MRILVFLLTLYLFPQNGYTDISPLVKCLAIEEQNFHDQKLTGPMYKLNQDLINLLAIENKLEFTDHITKLVCNSSTQAFTFLRNLLLGKNDLFVEPKKGIPDWEVTFFAQQVEQLISSNYELFLNFVAAVQVEIKSPYCLKKLVPGYSDYLVREKYLKDIQSQYLNKDSLEVMENLLDSISSVAELKEKCEKIDKNVKKNR